MTWTAMNILLRTRTLASRAGVRLGVIQDPFAEARRAGPATRPVVRLCRPPERRPAAGGGSVAASILATCAGRTQGTLAFHLYTHCNGRGNGCRLRSAGKRPPEPPAGPLAGFPRARD